MQGDLSTFHLLRYSQAERASNAIALNNLKIHVDGRFDIIYNTITVAKRLFQIVIDTNVFIAALRSRRGAAYKLLSLIGSDKFQVNVSVPLVLEYEDAAKRMLDDISLTAADIDDILDYLCAVANHKTIFYLWRPVLRDPKDEMVLELGVSARCDFIVTYNKRDFAEAEQFGLRVVTPQAFLTEIGELK